MSFNNYLEPEDDRKYFSVNSLSYYYDRLAAYARKVEGYDQELIQTIELNEERLKELDSLWDRKMQTFDDGVKDLLAEWVDDGTMDHVVDTSIVDRKIEPLNQKIDEKAPLSVFRFTPGTVGSEEAINTITGYKDNGIAPGIRGADVGQGSKNNENIIGAVLETVGQNVPNVIDPTMNTGHYAFVRGYDNGVNGLADVVIAYHVKAHKDATHATVVGGSYHEAKDGDYSVMTGGTRNLMEVLNGGAYSVIDGGHDHKMHARFSTIQSGSFGRIGTTASDIVYSFLLSSDRSTVDGSYAGVLSGNECKATKNYSLARGKGAVANNVGEFVTATGKFKTVGDTGHNDLHLMRQTTDGIAQQLFLDDANSTITAVGVNTAIAFEVLVTGIRVDAPGSASFKVIAHIERFTGVPELKALTVTPVYSSDPGYNADVIVTSSGYQIRCKGVSGHTINWSARYVSSFSRNI